MTRGRTRLTTVTSISCRSFQRQLLHLLQSFRAVLVVYQHHGMFHRVASPPRKNKRNKKLSHRERSRALPEEAENNRWRISTVVMMYCKTTLES